MDNQDLEHTEKIEKKRFSTKFVMFFGLLVCVALSATVYATVGDTDMPTPDLGFIQIAIEPREPIYAEDHGILINVMGARVVHNHILLYLSMEDTTGQNRLDIENNSLDVELFCQNGDMYIAPTVFITRYHRGTNRWYSEYIFTHSEDVSHIDYLDFRVRRISDLEQVDQTLLEGNWDIRIPLQESISDALEITNVNIDNMRFRRIRVTPLGIQKKGIIAAHSEGWLDVSNVSMEVEVANRRRNIVVTDGNTSVRDGGHFESNFFFNEPINLADVSAIVINGERMAF